MKWGWLLPFIAVRSLFALPTQLADTGYGLPANRPYVPQYPLWSDGALKER